MTTLVWDVSTVADGEGALPICQWVHALSDRWEVHFVHKSTRAIRMPIGARLMTDPHDRLSSDKIDLIQISRPLTLLMDQLVVQMSVFVLTGTIASSATKSGARRQSKIRNVVLANIDLNGQRRLGNNHTMVRERVFRGVGKTVGTVGFRVNLDILLAMSQLHPHCVSAGIKERRTARTSIDP